MRVCFDEGCNSNCHGDEWAANAEEKLKNMPHRSNGFEWVHTREKTYKGIGGAVAKTKGKRRMPAA